MNWTAVAAAAASIAATVAIYQAIQLKRASQLGVFERVFHDVRELERLFYESYQEKTEQQKQQWNSLFFNTLEYLSFLFNEQFLQDERLLDFCSEAILYWHDTIFLQTARSDEIEDRRTYPEFKKLCRDLRARRG